MLLMFVTAAVAMCLVTLAACSDSGSSENAAAGAGQERPPAPVSVAIMKKAPHALTSVLPGRASAFQTAEIRPRVSGIIKEIAFKEGNEVKQGDLLYKIEDDTYDLDAAKKELEAAGVTAWVLLLVRNESANTSICEPLLSRW